MLYMYIFKFFRKLINAYNKKKIKVFLRNDNISVFGNQDVLFEDRIEIGDGCSLNHNVYLNGMGGIKIGNNVTISAGVSLISTGLDPDKRNKTHINSSIFIGDGVWVGANATILQGITIGENSIIAAGSMVTKNIKKNEIWAGVPAIKLRDRF
ncbi:MAG: acyltransferase [Gammaproteobacteria bacterium]|nr:acyltransferase [Gammaproteobacteria bacterium]